MDLSSVLLPSVFVSLLEIRLAVVQTGATRDDSAIRTTLPGSAERLELMLVKTQAVLRVLPQFIEMRCLLPHVLGLRESVPIDRLMRYLAGAAAGSCARSASLINRCDL